jgi:hypothetical protein
MDVVALRGLCAYGSRENLGTAWQSPGPGLPQARPGSSWPEWQGPDRRLPARWRRGLMIVVTKEATWPHGHRRS